MVDKRYIRELPLTLTVLQHHDFATFVADKGAKYTKGWKSGFPTVDQFLQEMKDRKLTPETVTVFARLPIDMVDIDFDDIIACQSWTMMFGTTGDMVVGRASKSPSHIFVRSEVPDSVPIAVKAKRQEGGKEDRDWLEIRTSTVESVSGVVAYGEHRSGERLSLCGVGDPISPRQVEFDTLARNAVMAHLVCELVAHDEGPKQRHEHRLTALGFAMKTLGLTREETQTVYETVCALTGDTKRDDWSSVLDSTESLIDGGDVDRVATNRFPTNVRNALIDFAATLGVIDRPTGGTVKAKSRRQVADSILADQTVRLTDGRVAIRVDDEFHLIDSPQVSSHIWSCLAAVNKSAMPSTLNVRNVRDYVEAGAAKLPKTMMYAVQRGMIDGTAWMRGAGDAAYIAIDDDGVRVEDESPIILARPSEPWPGLPAPRLDEGVIVDGLRILVDRYLAGLVPMERLKFVLAVLQGLRPGARQYMPVIIVGPHGSAKTSRLWVMNMIIAPRIDWIVASSIPEPRDLFTAMRNRSVITFDNASRVTQAQSNTIAPAATGFSRTQRALFTDDRELTASGAWLFLMSAISNPIYSPDMRSRTLVIQTEAIPTNQYMSEDRFRSRFLEDYSIILGAFLQLLSLALKRVKVFDEDSLIVRPRMFDTAVFCETVREELNEALYLALQPGDIAQLLVGEEEESAIDALESSPFVSALVDYLDEVRAYNTRFNEMTDTNWTLVNVTLDEVRKIVTDFHDWRGVYSTWADSVFARQEREKRRQSDHTLPPLEPPGRRYQSERDPTWPKTAEAVSKLLERHAAGLRAAGIEVVRAEKRTGKKRRRELTIRWVEGEEAVA